LLGYDQTIKLISSKSGEDRAHHKSYSCRLWFNTYCHFSSICSPRSNWRTI
uniref:Uncharacterized protein n=1 Tax=Aegilops tauschii subsp. strangulata TaxID=200361 RepID=A0A453S4T6_AEGTS